MTTRLFFDIETRANPAALARLPEPEAPANYKDAAKIAAAIAEKKAQQAAQAALDPDTGYVSSIAWQAGPPGTPPWAPPAPKGPDRVCPPPTAAGVSRTAPARLPVPGRAGASVNAEPQIHVLVPLTADVADPVPDTVTLYVYSDAAERDRMERLLIEHFWAAFARANGVCAGYNILAFDLPFLLRRSMALQAQPPAVLPVLARYRTEPVHDLYALLYQWGPGKGLKTVAELYGLPNELPGLTGVDVAGMDWRTEAAYAVNDLQLLIALHQRMAGFFWPVADGQPRPSLGH